MNSREDKINAFGRMLDVVNELREKCPWDAKQTFDSLRPNTIEEVYELTDALAAKRMEDVKKELGDVLLHIAFYSRIAEEKELFDIADVAKALTDKLIFRHPHVYGEVKADSTQKVLENWEALKLKEKGGNGSVLGGVPSTLPALIKAFRIQEKAAHCGFDWEKPEQVWSKVKEEVAETEQELTKSDCGDVEAEIGDLLFSIINVARLYGVNPENALERTNRKFITRFNHIEQRAHQSNKAVNELSLREMDEYWEEAKKEEPNVPTSSAL